MARLGRAQPNRPVLVRNPAEQEDDETPNPATFKVGPPRQRWYVGNPESRWDVGTPHGRWHVGAPKGD